MNSYVLAMVLIRLMSAAIELTGAFFMAQYNRVDAALRINGLLGLVGPTVLMLVSIVGLTGLAGQLSPAKTLLVLAGVLLIILGTR